MMGPAIPRYGDVKDTRLKEMDASGWRSENDWRNRFFRPRTPTWCNENRDRISVPDSFGQNERQDLRQIVRIILCLVGGIPETCEEVHKALRLLHKAHGVVRDFVTRTRDKGGAECSTLIGYIVHAVSGLIVIIKVAIDATRTFTTAFDVVGVIG